MYVGVPVCLLPHKNGEIKEKRNLGEKVCCGPTFLKQSFFYGGGNPGVVGVYFMEIFRVFVFALHLNSSPPGAKREAPLKTVSKSFSFVFFTKNSLRTEKASGGPRGQKNFPP